MATYRVKSEFSHIPELVDLVNGRRVALNGAYTKTIPADAGRPERTVSVPAATQADLAVLFKNGNPCVEEGEAAREQAPVAKANG